MHCVTLSQPIKTKRWDLPAGTFVMEDLTAFEIGIDADRGATKLQPYLIQPAGFYTMTDPVLLISNGGYGDMVTLTPAIRAFRKKWPGRPLMLSCRERYRCVFDGLDYAPVLVDYPIKLSDIHPFTRVITTEHLHAGSPERFTVHATDINATVLGASPLVGDDRKADYCISDAETEWSMATYPRFAIRKRIAIQLQASSPSRTYHPKRAGEVMKMLYEKGHELFILGTPGSMPKSAVPDSIGDRVKNITQDNLTFRQSAAVMAQCDCLWCPDSSLMHVAGAIGLPTIAVFASTHWKLRTSDFPSVLAIQSNVGCDKAPCFWHPKGAQIWVEGAVCEKEGHCVPLNSITPERIVSLIERKLNP